MENSNGGVKKGPLSMWVITNSPRDMRGFFVARRHEITTGQSRPTEDHYAHRDLDMLRLQLHEEFPHLMRVARDPKDDPVIVETWI